MTPQEGDRSRVGLCEVWTHPAGWWLRLTIDGASLPLATIVRSADAMRTLVETWRAVMSAKGWS
jgi:hypothetical protein